jgi:peptide/nickel transport system substrate-binding protein
MKTSKPALAAIAAGAVIFTLAGCTGSADPASSPIDGGTLTIAEAADTVEVDPQLSFYDSSWRFQDLVYDSLVATNADSEIVPSIAESWTEDGTTYTFTLREGVTFSNGRALTADDVVGSLQRLVDPELFSYWATQVGPVSSVEAIDERTVSVELERPWTQFVASLASTSAAILPIEELNAGTFDPATDMLGTGPFVLEAHTQDQEWIFSANEHYWDAANVALDEVIVKIIPDDAARVGAIRDGSVDIAYFSSPDAPTLLAGTANVETVVQGSTDMYWLLLNTVNPDSPFTNAELRQAVATAIDRDAVIQTGLAGTGLATAVTPAGLPGACEIETLPTYGGTADDAAAILAESGLEGTEFEIISPPYLSTFDSIAQVLQQDWTDAGLDVTISTPEMGDYIDRMYVQQPGDFDAAIEYFAGFLYPTMAADPLAATAPGPLAGLISIELAADTAAALAQARATGNADDMQRVCEIVAETANAVPLATKSTTIAVRTDQVDADVPEFDGYDIYLRNLTSYVKLG